MHVFSKVLCNTDVTERLEVPSEALQHFRFPSGERTRDIKVRDSQQQVWEFCLSKRREGYGKPCLRRAGWLPFVKAKCLKKDDIVMIFSVPEDEDGAAAGAVKYRIVAKKYIKLMGQVISVDV